MSKHVCDCGAVYSHPDQLIRCAENRHWAPADQPEIVSSSAPVELDALRRERDEARAENTRLRAALAHSSGACVYCSLPADEWAKCELGFPGCARADDAMGCAAFAEVTRVMAERNEAVRALEMVRDQLSEAMHTALRKGADSTAAHQAWTAIRNMPDWGAAVDWALDAMGVLDALSRLSRKDTDNE